MPTPANTRKNKTVLSALRQWILTHGRPGSRLPTRHEMAELHGVSPMTAQRAFDRLAADGFVVSRGRNGTFVVDKPPHLFRYGIVFSSDPSGGEGGYWPPAWQAFNAEALRVQHVDRRREVVPFYNVTGHIDSEDFQRLNREIECGRLAGLIFSGWPMPDSVANSPVWEHPDLPRVVLSGSGVPGKAVLVSAGQWDAVEPALDAFAAAGRKRIAIVDLPGSVLLDPKRTIAAIEQRGMTTRPYWLLGVNHQTNYSATQVVQLLMSGRPEERPDGLFIANPFLVEPATAGLAAAGVRIPHDLSVIAGGNFPHLTRSHVPVRWLGVDIREIIRTAIDLIDRQRRGEAIEQVTTMPNIFEEQLSPEDSLKRLIEV